MRWMPRYVDHEDRRAQIVQATLEILADRGPRGLTFRAVASKLGGSSTLITHYFATRQALLDAIVETMSDWPSELADLEMDTDDEAERLRRFLIWMVPSTEFGRMQERGRINLLGEPDAKLHTRHIFESWDAEVRDLFRHHLRNLVPADEMELKVDVLRSVTNGLTLSAIEHPDHWPLDRQTAVIDESLAALGLRPATKLPG
jgi:AcrR family transcriptional regulator